MASSQSLSPITNHLPTEIQLLIFHHLSLLSRVHEPRPSWVIYPPRPPEVLLISRASRNIALRSGGFQLLPLYHRTLKDKRREVLKIWWHDRDILYFGPLCLMLNIDLKLGLRLQPPFFYAGSSYSYLCSILDVSIFGGADGATQGSGDTDWNSLRKRVKVVAVQKEIWEKLGTGSSRARQETLERFRDWWPTWRKSGNEDIENVSWHRKVLVVEGDAAWFAQRRGELMLKPMQGYAGDEISCQIIRGGYEGWKDYKTRLEEQVDHERKEKAKLRDSLIGDESSTKKWRNTLRGLVRRA